MMDLDSFHARLAQPDARGHVLDDKQCEAVNFGDGPLWLLAGPGSGKSEVLVTRTLRLLCVDGVAPRSVLVTTFTKKAGRNLEDRLASYLSALQRADAGLVGVDLADLRVGTLHSLCNDILQEYRYPPYQNVRLLDDVEQHLFAYHRATIRNHDDVAFWTFFEHCVPSWSAARGFPPSKWRRIKAAVVLFNHIVEDLVDLDRMTAAGGHWATLAGFYRQYAEALEQHYRCDFAHLQARFLEFLRSNAGRSFLEGDGESRPPLQHVLVDEYQDTNPIQERIYLALAQHAPHNLTVVGDDDQALYRFRGGTVACMVNFDRACAAAFGTEPEKIQLDRNYRSHPEIVRFFNDYIESFPEMTAPGVRAPGKLRIEPRSQIGGSHPAVAWLTTRRAGDLAGTLAALIKDHLLADGIVQDPSQCVLLLRSAKDSPRNAGPFLAAFRQAGLNVYNPRSKSFMEAEEVQCLLASLVEVVDPNHTYRFSLQPELPDTVRDWFRTLDAVRQGGQVPTQPLLDYLTQSKQAIPRLCQSRPGNFLGISLLEILYRILSREPFRTWRRDPSQNMRLSKVTRLFESYHSLRLDTLISDAQGTELDQRFRDRFYNVFISYLIETGIDDDEDEDVIVPRGYLPVMTIHQSKGLEFPFVFVAQVGDKGRPGSAQILEHDLAPFRLDLYPRTIRDADLLALEDDVRLLYVAYSRAQYALIVVATDDQIKKHVAVPRRDALDFRRKTPVIP